MKHYFNTQFNCWQTCINNINKNTQSTRVHWMIQWPTLYCYSHKDEWLILSRAVKETGRGVTQLWSKAHCTSKNCVIRAWKLLRPVLWCLLGTSHTLPPTKMKRRSAQVKTEVTCSQNPVKFSTDTQTHLVEFLHFSLFILVEEIRREMIVFSEHIWCLCSPRLSWAGST